MTSRKRIEDSVRWRAVGRIEAGQSITDEAISPYKWLYAACSGLNRQCTDHLRVMVPRGQTAAKPPEHSCSCSLKLHRPAQSR
ncbi:hypothetical protein TNCV_4413491 [Trichonephila clavipes]|nr:hypothetical protein TNCV_4413491 [Trichonephila clavipes]